MCTFQHKDDNPLFWLSLELPFRMQSRITEVCNTSGSAFHLSFPVTRAL